MQLIQKNNGHGRELLAYIERRINKLRTQVSSPLINEREADTLRGRIAELQRLDDAVHTEGEMGNE